MFFSIIIPLFNKEDYVLRAVMSVLEQSYDSFEVIIVDDGSTDGSLMKISDIQDPRVHIVETDNNGVSVARNIAIGKSHGDYLVFLDADDTFDVDYLRTIHDGIVDYSFPEMIVSGVSIISEDNLVIVPRKVGVYNSTSFREVFFDDEVNNHGLPGYIAGKAVSNSFIKENGICFNPQLSLAEDLDFWLQCYRKASSIVSIDYSGYNYYVGLEGSSVFQTGIDYISQLNIWSKIYSYVIPKDDKAKQVFNQKFTGYALSAFNEMREVRYKEVKRLLKEIKHHKSEIRYELVSNGKMLCPLVRIGFAPFIYLYLKIREIYHDKRNCSCL